MRLRQCGFTYLRGIIASLACIGLCMGCGGSGDEASSALSSSRGAGTEAISASQVQAELAALETPAGVDAGLFAKLKQTLSQAVTAQAQAGKLISGLPAGEDNAVNDLALESVAGSNYLVWTYRNIGDYDQNGEVGSADIVPIAMYFHQTSADVDTWDRAHVADGDSNGEVNSSDIVPIAMYYGTTTSGYNIYGTADQAQPWFRIGYMSLQDARDQQIAGDEGKPLRFSFQVPGEPQYLSFYVAPTNTIDDGVGSNEVTISTEPAGITDVTPKSGISGGLVEFVPATTGSLLTYDWDFGGGAEPNTSEFAHPLVTLGDPGDYTVTVIVDNDFGDPAQFQFTLTVEEHQGEPVDVYRVQPWGGAPNSVVTFEAVITAGTPPFTYQWNFGGGANPNTSTEATPQVTLLSAGYYNAYVTVDNEFGEPEKYDFILSVE